MKKFLALLLCILMLTALLPFSALAEEPAAEPETVEEPAVPTEEPPAAEPEMTEEPAAPEEESAPEAEQPAEEPEPVEPTASAEEPEIPAQEPEPVEEPAEPAAEPETPVEGAEELPEESAETPEALPWLDLDDEAFIAYILTPENADYLAALFADTASEEYAAFAARVEAIGDEEARAAVNEYLLTLIPVEEEPAEAPAEPEAPAQEEEAPAEPIITVQPIADAVIADGAAELICSASYTGAAELCYQWQKLYDLNDYASDIGRNEAWQDIPGATGEVLLFSGLDAETFAAYENMRFRCVVRSADDAEISGEARLLSDPAWAEQLPEEQPEAPEEEPLPEEQPEAPEEEPLPEEQPEAPEEEQLPEEQPEAPEGEMLPEEETGEAEEPAVEETVWEEETVLAEDVLIAQGAKLTVLKKCTVPEGIILTVEGTLCIAEEAAVEIGGTLIFGETAVYEGAPEALILLEGGILEGTEHIRAEEPEAPTGMTWEELLAAGVFAAEEPVTLTGELLLPADKMMILQAGELILAEGASLKTEGLLVIGGGTLTVMEGAKLENGMFLQVCGSGALLVRGTYKQDETAALVWEETEPGAGALVEGVEAKYIDRTVVVADREALEQALSRDGFRTMTVIIPDREMADELKGTIPAGVILSVR